MNRNPWDDIPNFTDKKYLNWLRSSVRRVWNKSPIKLEFKKKRRYKAPVGRKTEKHPEGQPVWVSDCEICDKQSRKCEVDHIEMGGSFNDWTSFCEWAKRILWVTFDDIRELCPDCHAIVTHMQKTGLSWEEAVRDKERILFFKQSVKEQKEQLMEMGATEEAVSNKEKREVVYAKFRPTKERLEEICKSGAEELLKTKDGNAFGEFEEE